MSKIKDIRGREIIDSRGNPTVEADVVLESGALGRAAVPSGASTGTREAVELRDGDKQALRRQGRAQGGRARQHRAAPGAARHATPATRQAIDRRMIELDGTDTKGRLGRQCAARPSRSPTRTRRRARREQPLYRQLAQLIGGGASRSCRCR